MNTPTKARVRKICGVCGSADVRADAWAEWDERTQAWVLAELFDAAYCNDCDGETRIKEKALKASRKPAPRRSTSALDSAGPSRL